MGKGSRVSCPSVLYRVRGSRRNNNVIIIVYGRNTTRPHSDEEPCDLKSCAAVVVAPTKRISSVRGAPLRIEIPPGRLARRNGFLERGNSRSHNAFGRGRQHSKRFVRYIRVGKKKTRGLLLKRLVRNDDDDNLRADLCTPTRVI